MRAWIEIISRIPALKGLIVALFMRVWIEMRMDRASKLIICSRPLHEGVGWNIRFRDSLKLLPCRPLHEGVGWNIRFRDSLKLLPCRPLHEGVDWNKGIFLASQCKSQVALFTRAWIEIAWRCRYVQSSSSVTLSASASFLAVDILQSPLRSMFSIVLTGTPDSWDNAGTVSSLFSLSCLKFISILLSVFYNPVYDFCCSERDEQDA